MADTRDNPSSDHAGYAPFQVGSVLVVPDLNLVSAGSERRRLEPKVMKVLCTLASRPGELLSRHELIDEVWGVEHGADESLTRAISLLRNVLSVKGERSSVIETIPKSGYRLVAEIGEAVADESAVGRPEDKVVLVPVRQPWQRDVQVHPFRYLAVVLGFVVLMLSAGIWIGQSSKSLPVPENSVAVLPFETLGPDSDNDYFARGLTDEIRSLLTQLNALNVAGRNASVLQSESGSDAVSLGRDLRVSHVLTGSVRWDTDRILVSAELVDTSTGYEVWSHNYDRTLTVQNLFDLQRDIATDVAGALSISLNVPDENRLQGSETSSLEAYNYYLRAREADVLGPGSRSEAIALYEAAIRLDPEYPSAWAMLAATLAADSWNASSADEARVLQAKGRKMAEEALRLNPGLAQAQASLAVFQSLDKQWLDAAKSTQMAADLSPDGSVLLEQTLFLLRVGKVAEAHRVALKGQANNPLSLERTAALAMTYAMVGEPEQSKDMLSRFWALQSPPGTWDAYAWSLDMQSDMDLSELRALCLRLADVAPSLSQLLGPVIDSLPDRLAARDAVAQQFELGAGAHPDRREILAAIAAKLDDPALALRIWRQELDGNRLRLSRVWGPLYADMRQLPEFRSLVSDLNLVDYWGEEGWPDSCRPRGEADFECF